jgi:hypothetical protein
LGKIGKGRRGHEEVLNKEGSKWLKDGSEKA